MRVSAINSNNNKRCSSQVHTFNLMFLLPRTHCDNCPVRTHVHHPSFSCTIHEASHYSLFAISVDNLDFSSGPGVLPVDIGVTSGTTPTFSIGTETVEESAADSSETEGREDNGGYSDWRRGTGLLLSRIERLHIDREQLETVEQLRFGASEPKTSKKK